MCVDAIHQLLSDMIPFPFPPRLYDNIFIHFFSFFCSAVKQALYLIKEMDHDGDGQISEAEVLKNQETFMNSEVTDYGRHLHVSHDEL